MISVTNVTNALEGKTDTSKARIQAIYWCGTLFNYENIYDKIIKRLKSICLKYIIGKEICPTTGRKHLQFFLKLKKKMRLTEIKIDGNPHLERCLGSEEDNIKYCSKEHDFEIYPQPVKIINDLYPWQKIVLEYFLNPVDDRSVYWFYDESGNIGKSAFVKYLVVKYGALFCDGGRKQDLINLVFNNDMNECSCVIWDLPRVNKNNISYSTIESIKNGMICNTKYETGVKVFNSPHIFIFSNFAPEEDKLSNDRWIIRNLNTMIKYLEMGFN